MNRAKWISGRGARRDNVWLIELLKMAAVAQHKDSVTDRKG